MKEQNFTPKTALIIFAIGLAGGLGGFAIANSLSPEKESEIKEGPAEREEPAQIQFVLPEQEAGHEYCAR